MELGCSTPLHLVGTCQYEKFAVDIQNKMWAFHDTEILDDPGHSQMSVPMAGFGLVDTIVNRANGRRPRLPPLPFPSSVFLLIHPSRNIPVNPVNPVACHGSFEFSHRKPPKTDRERPLPLRSLLALALSQEIETRPETLTVIKLSIIELAIGISDGCPILLFCF